MTNSTEKDILILEKVPNRFYGSLKKFWRRTFVDYEIWWWTLVFGLLIWVVMVSPKYLPVLMPDTFRDQYVEKSLGKFSDLTIFYPPRVVPGHEYKLDFSFRVPDNLPDDTEKVTFQLNANLAGAKLDPTVIEFNANQTGWVVQQVTFKILESSTLHDETTLSIKSPQFKDDQNLEIPIVNWYYSVSFIVTFIVTFGALILKVFSPLLTRLWTLLKNIFAEKSTKV